MELKDLASVSGKGGLFKIVKPGKTTVLLESLDEEKTKLVASASHRLSLLEEISIYTRTKEGTTPLGDVLRKINKEFSADLGVDANSRQKFLKKRKLKRKKVRVNFPGQSFPLFLPFLMNPRKTVCVDVASLAQCPGSCTCRPLPCLLLVPQ